MKFVSNKTIFKLNFLIYTNSNQKSENIYTFSKFSIFSNLLTVYFIKISLKLKKL